MLRSKILVRLKGCKLGSDCARIHIWCPSTVVKEWRFIYYFVTLVFEAYKHRRLFCSILGVRYFGFLIGSDCFWPKKDVSLNVETSLLVPLETIKHEGSTICIKDEFLVGTYLCV